MSTDNPPSDFGVYGEPVWGAAWDGMIAPGSVIFTSGSSHILPSGELYILASGEHPGVSIIDDPIPVNENPPFPGWDPATQVVRLTDENGPIVVAAGYHSLAICDDLELDAEDFGMRSAKITTNPTIAIALGKPPMLTAVEAASREAMEVKGLSAEIERLTTELHRLTIELRRLELERMSVGVAAPPPAVSPSSWGTVPPYTKKVWDSAPPRIGEWGKGPIVKEEGWARDPVFGPTAGSAAPTTDDFVFDTSRSTSHDDNVDAVGMSLGARVRKAIGIGFGVGR